jgi:hypothetical protein
MKNALILINSDGVLSLRFCTEIRNRLRSGGVLDDSSPFFYVRLETAKGRHKVYDLAGGRGFAGFKVALNAQSGEEGQHHLRNC